MFRTLYLCLVAPWRNEHVVLQDGCSQPLAWGAISPGRPFGDGCAASLPANVGSGASGLEPTVPGSRCSACTACTAYTACTAPTLHFCIDTIPTAARTLELPTQAGSSSHALCNVESQLPLLEEGSRVPAPNSGSTKLGFQVKGEPCVRTTLESTALLAISGAPRPQAHPQASGDSGANLDSPNYQL